MAKINDTADKYLIENSRDDLRSVIDKYGFSVSYNGKSFLVADPVIQAVDGKSAGKHTGKDLDTLLQNAVDDRIVFDSNPKPVQGAEVTDAEPIPVTEPEPQPEPVTLPVVTDTDPQPEPEGETVTETPEKKGDLSGDIELDDTGKRLRKPKVVKEPREPKANRYERTSNLLLGNLSISSAEVSEKAPMSPSMAVFCIEAFRGITKSLLEAGIIPKNKAALVTVPPKPSKK
jgi:hypothetical protein